MSFLYRQIPFEAAATGAAAVVAAGGSTGGDAGAQAAAATAAKPAVAATGGDGGAAAAAAAKPKPFFEGFYGPDGKIDKTALDRLPDHLKPHKDVLGKYDTIEALLGGFGNAHSMAVKKAMAPLTGTEPPEVVAERKAHLDQINGVPKDPKDYGITRPDDLPEQFWNQEAAGKFGQIAQKHSISPAAVKDLLSLQLETTQGELARGKTMEAEFYASQDKAFEGALKKMGMDADKAANFVSRGAATLGIDAKDPVLKNAAVRLALVRACQLVSEEKLVTGDPSGGDAAGNELAQARDIMNNPQNPLHKAWRDPNDPRHESAKDKVNALYQTFGERTAKRGGL